MENSLLWGFGSLIVVAAIYTALAGARAVNAPRAREPESASDAYLGCECLHSVPALIARLPAGSRTAGA